MLVRNRFVAVDSLARCCAKSNICIAQFEIGERGGFGKILPYLQKECCMVKLDGYRFSRRRKSNEQTHNHPTSTILESTTLSCMALARPSTASVVASLPTPPATRRRSPSCWQRCMSTADGEKRKPLQNRPFAGSVPKLPRPPGGQYRLQDHAAHRQGVVLRRAAGARETMQRPVARLLGRRHRLDRRRDCGSVPLNFGLLARRPNALNLSPLDYCRRVWVVI